MKLRALLKAEEFLQSSNWITKISNKTSAFIFRLPGPSLETPFFVIFIKSCAIFAVRLPITQHNITEDPNSQHYCFGNLEYRRRVQPTRYDVSQFIYFCKTMYTFQTAFPSIIRSSKLHIQRPVFVRPILLPAASQASSR